MTTWVLVIAFLVCPTDIDQPCHEDRILAHAEPTWCMSSVEDWATGKEHAQTVLMESGPDAGRRYPVTDAFCLEPIEDQATVPAAYPQE